MERTRCVHEEGGSTIDRYQGTIAAIISAILRETKDGSGAHVLVENLRDYYTADTSDTNDDVQIGDLLEYIASTSGEAISVSKVGGKDAINVLDKTSLWIMLYSLEVDLADASLLHWTDFEKLVQHAMVENGYLTRKNYRFMDGKGYRHEVDVVAIDRHAREHFIFLIDAKHWDYRANSSTARLMEAANEQYNRCVALGDSHDVLSGLLHEFKISWTRCIIVPMVVTLLAPPVHDFFIPIVSILQFNEFIQDFAEHMDTFKKKYVNDIRA